jgi:hypothetical protein
VSQLADQISAAYYAGDTTTANALVAENHVTAADAALYWNIPAANLDKIRAQGFAFADDHAGGNAPPGGGSGMGNITIQLPPGMTGAVPPPQPQIGAGLGSLLQGKGLLIVAAVAVILIMRK